MSEHETGRFIPNTNPDNRQYDPNPNQDRNFSFGEGSMHGNSFYVWFYAIQLKELVMNNQLSFGPQGGAPCDMHSLVYQRGRLDSRDACLVSRRADENPRQKRPSKSEIQALPAVKTQAKILLSGRAQAKTRNSPRDMGAKLQTINQERNSTQQSYSTQSYLLSEGGYGGNQVVYESAEKDAPCCSLFGF